MSSKVAKFSSLSITQGFDIVKTISCRLKGHKLSIQHLRFIWPMRALCMYDTRGLNCADAVFLNVFANVYSGQTVSFYFKMAKGEKCLLWANCPCGWKG